MPFKDRKSPQAVASRLRADAAYREKLKARHRELVALLGGVCVKCGSKDFLEIDHEEGKPYESKSVGHRARVEKYWDEYNKGVKLRVLCKPCNSGHRNNTPRPTEEPKPADYVYTEDDKA